MKNQVQVLKDQKDNIDSSTWHITLIELKCN